MSQNNCPAGNSIVFVSPDTPSKCTWKLGDKTQNTVHSSRPA